MLSSLRHSFSRVCFAPLRPFPGARWLCTAPAQPAAHSTPDTLKDFLHTVILARGPISVAEFMRHALAHPTLGYYTTRTVFGTAGDFTTSPEISQMFGEIVGVWCVSMWEQLGKPPSLALVEIGPGKGTLMADVLRTCRRFPACYAALSVHLVEISEKLTVQQRAALGCPPVPAVASIADLPSPPPLVHADGTEVSRPSASTSEEEGIPNGRTPDGKTISWHWRFGEVAQSPRPLLVLAHELFDALPVHQFQFSAGRGWAERLVDVIEADRETPSSSEASAGERADVTVGECASSGLRLTLAPSPTPAHAAYARLLDAVRNPPPTHGDVIEFSPAASALAHEVATAVGAFGGGALIMDYGRSHATGASVRGIKDHAFVDMLENPGCVDLSADVDFSALKHAVTQAEGAQAHGPLSQREFLSEMGIAARLEALLDGLPDDDELAADRLMSEAYRLVSPDQMGEVYKVLAITRKPPAPEAALPDAVGALLVGQVPAGFGSTAVTAQTASPPPDAAEEH